MYKFNTEINIIYETSFLKDFSKHSDPINAKINWFASKLFERGYQYLTIKDQISHYFNQ